MPASIIYKRLFLLAKPYWFHVGSLFALTLMSVPLTLLNPIPLKIAVDSAIGDVPLPSMLQPFADAVGGAEWRAALFIAIGILILITLVSQLQQASKALLNTYVANKLLLHFRSELFKQVQRLSLSYHDMRGSSDSLYRIQYDATAIQSIVIEGAIPFIVSTASVVSMVYVTMRIDVQLALVALSVAPLLVFLVLRYRPRLRTMSKNVRRLESSAMSVVQETLGAVRVVKVFGQERRERARFDEHSDEGLSAMLRLARTERTMGMWVGLVIASGTALVLYVGVSHVQEGTLTLGNLLLVMGYLSSLYSPLKSAASRAAKLQNYLIRAERAFELLDQAPDVEEKPNAISVGRARGAITMEGVYFSYDGETDVLQGVSFEVPAGHQVGIRGETGAGKTTALNLLLRLYDPTRGRILLDGVDLRDYRLSDLRAQFSVVLQEPVLFSTSIAENIAYARPGASEQEVVAAARAANAHDFILALPNGYSEPVGERGMRLSGGERQRISLARAFLRDAPILILDEPTSSVDTETESQIMDAMQRLMKNRTTFMVAHRLSTLETCDLMIEVSDGQARVRGRGAGLSGTSSEVVGSR